MADIDETISRYEEVCKEDKSTPNSYIVRMLAREKATCASERRTTMNLYLAGNDEKFSASRLEDKDIEILYKALRNNLYIVALDLRYNRITDVGAQHLAQLLEESVMIKDVNLMGNDIEEEGAKHIAKALHKNDTLVSLKMTGNKIGNKGGMYFAQALQINTTLEKLDLADTDQKTESLIAMATVLNYNTTLKAVNLNRPILFSQQEETTVHVANMLKVNRTLKELHLAKHETRDFGATRLSENLMNNFTLTYVDLSCNRITMDGAKELAKLLKQDTSLKVLDLSQNRLSDDGAQAIAQALATYNTHLTTLIVPYNEIKGKGLCALAESLRFNTALTNIYIWGNKLEESACIAFSKLLTSGRLEAKNTDVEPYVVDGITYLSELHHSLRRHYYRGLYGIPEQKDIVIST